MTTLGIACSFIKPVKKAPGSYAMGQYLIYMFSVGIGLSFRTTDLSIRALYMLAFFAMVQFGAIILHFLI